MNQCPLNLARFAGPVQQGCARFVPETPNGTCSLRHKSRSVLSLRYAPRVGLEPTTNRLHLPPRFHGERTISSPRRGAGRSRLAYWLGSSPASLCTFPVTRYPSPGLAQDCRHPKCCGFPEFTPFFRWPLLTRAATPLQPVALLIELSGKLVNTQGIHRILFIEYPRGG